MEVSSNMGEDMNKNPNMDGAGDGTREVIAFPFSWIDIIT